MFSIWDNTFIAFLSRVVVNLWVFSRINTITDGRGILVLNVCEDVAGGNDRYVAAPTVENIAMFKSNRRRDPSSF